MKKAEKNPNAVALGKLGGKASVEARTPEAMQALMKRAGKRSAELRWKDHEYSMKPSAIAQREWRARRKREKAGSE